MLVAHQQPCTRIVGSLRRGRRRRLPLARFSATAAPERLLAWVRGGDGWVLPGCESVVGPCPRAAVGWHR